MPFLRAMLANGISLRIGEACISQALTEVFMIDFLSGNKSIDCLSNLPVFYAFFNVFNKIIQSLLMF